MALEIDELKVVMESPAATARRLRITVPAEQVARERRQAVARIAQKVRLPGFRKGKVPASVVEKRFGAAVDQEMLERVMGEAYRQVLRREGLQPITDGAIDNVQYQSGADLTFDVGFEVRPDVQLNRLGGFTVKRPAAEVDEAQADRVLERLRDENAQWQPFDDATPVNGDMVAVEITPLDDVAGPERKPRRYELILGEGQAAAAIEDVIRTLRPGEENDVTVLLPENAEEPTAGEKPHSIHLHLLEARHAVKPELDDAFAKSLGDFEDLPALRARIREDLGREAEREAERAVRQQLLGHIVDANPFELPESMVDQYLRQMVPDREGHEERVAEARASVRQPAEHALRRMLVIEKVAEMESLTVSEAELDARLAEMAERAGRDARELRTMLRKNNRLHELVHEMTEDKVLDYLKSLSTIEQDR